jgi:hypothetical protein
MAGEEQPLSTSYARMLETGQIRDPIRGIRPAGKSTAIFDDSAQKDVQSEIYFPLPPTPRSLQRFRRNYIPGEINRHYGYHDLKLPAKDFTYGSQTNSGISAAATLEAGKKEGIAEYMRMRAEQTYASTKREPLGRAIDRGYNYPGPIKNDASFRFGMAPHVRDPDGKEIIFPRGIEQETPAQKDQYVFTHGSYDPGQMIDRKYNWPKDEAGQPIDPKNFAFGLKDKLHSSETAKAALSMDRDGDGNYPHTRIVPLTAEAYREVALDPLGRAKNNMQGKQPLKPDHAYGIKCIGSDTTVGDCLRGWYSEPEQMPEFDLGKCQKVGRRNVPDGDRAFGVPSIRADITKPERRSCADTQNYGDEAGASALLHPQRFELMGVPDEDFLLRRDKDEMKSILDAAGIPTPHFDMLFETAVQLFDDGKSLVSLDAYLYVTSNLINDQVAKRELKIPDER